jgi:uncharacterized membrane protein
MPSEKTSGLTRLEAFSDGVIAIIITIMVLELKLPEHGVEHGLWEGLVKPLAPKFVAYGLSFVVIAIMWVNHHAMIATARRASRAVLWCNIHLLFWMSLIPFATAIVGDNPFLPRRVAIYGFVMFASASAFTLLRWCIAREEHADKEMKRLHAAVMRKNYLGMALYGLSVPLAFVSVTLSIAIFFLIPAMFFLPQLLPGEKGESEQ